MAKAEKMNMVPTIPKINAPTANPDIFAKTEPGSEPDKVYRLTLDEMRPFPHHPFKLYKEEKMADMVGSISQHGVYTPIIVRRGPDNGYEIIAGHNRVEASKQAGLTDIPTIIRDDLDDDAATILMVDSNISQRDEILPSEKAWAYRMKLEAMKRQGERTDLTSDQVGRKLRNREAREIMSEQVGDSKTQILRFVRLTYLIPPLLESVDRAGPSDVKFIPAVELSYLDEADQTLVWELMESDGISPSLSQAQSLRKLASEDGLTEELVEQVMCEDKPEKESFSFSAKKIYESCKRHNINPTTRQAEYIVSQLLDKWERGEVEIDLTPIIDNAKEPLPRAKTNIDRSR